MRSQSEYRSVLLPGGSGLPRSSVLTDRCSHLAMGAVERGLLSNEAAAIGQIPAAEQRAFAEAGLVRSLNGDVIAPLGSSRRHRPGLRLLTPRSTAKKPSFAHTH